VAGFERTATGHLPDNLQRRGRTWSISRAGCQPGNDWLGAGCQLRSGSQDSGECLAREDRRCWPAPAGAAAAWSALGISYYGDRLPPWSRLGGVTRSHQLFLFGSCLGDRNGSALARHPRTPAFCGGALTGSSGGGGASRAHRIKAMASSWPLGRWGMDRGSWPPAAHGVIDGRTAGALPGHLQGTADRFEISGTLGVGVGVGAHWLVAGYGDRIAVCSMGFNTPGALERRSWWRLAHAADNARGSVQVSHSSLRAGAEARRVSGVERFSDTSGSCSSG